MRRGFAQEATLRLGSGADAAGPGAAITAALCGAWDHEPPCLLAAHHTAAERIGSRVHLRVVFVAAPVEETRVRGLIRAALAAGTVPGGPDAGTRWTLCSTTPERVHPDESDLVARLARTMT